MILRFFVRDSQFDALLVQFFCDVRLVQLSLDSSFASAESEAVIVVKCESCVVAETTAWEAEGVSHSIQSLPSRTSLLTRRPVVITILSQRK